ncbi:hypothetical protein KR032_000315, partial [Drosophila birchii]
RLKMTNRYDRLTTLYTPDGRLMQVEYAAKAVNNSFTVIGIRGKDSVVLAVDKIIRSSLYEPDADGRIFSLERHIGMAMAGFTPDGQIVVEAARVEVANYRRHCSSGIPVSLLCERLAGVIHTSTMHAIRRPFGISIILASWTEVDGPQIYKIDSTGSFRAYYACANGRTKAQALREYDKLENVLEMDTEDLVKSAGEIICKSHYDRHNRPFLFEMGIVGRATGGLHLINPPNLTKMARAAGIVAGAIDTSSSSDD